MTCTHGRPLSCHCGTCFRANCFPLATAFLSYLDAYPDTQEGARKWCADKAITQWEQITGWASDRGLDLGCA